MANAFGIDLGTYTINLYNSSKKNFLKEINMIAIENKNTLFAYGDSAYEMYEKAQELSEVTRCFGIRYRLYTICSKIFITAKYIKVQALKYLSL